MRREGFEKRSAQLVGTTANFDLTPMTISGKNSLLRESRRLIQVAMDFARRIRSSGFETRRRATGVVAGKKQGKPLADKDVTMARE